jgi:hypothetical protein
MSRAGCGRGLTRRGEFHAQRSSRQRPCRGPGTADRVPRQADRLLGVPGQAGHLGGMLQQSSEVHRAGGGCRWAQVPQGKRSLIIGVCLGVCRGALRGAAGVDRGQQRLMPVAGGVPVMSELTEFFRAGLIPLGSTVGQSRRVFPVQRRPLGRQHVRVDRLLAQRMPEDVDRTVHGQHVMLHGLAHRGQQFRLCQAGDPGQQAVFDPAPGYRRGAEHVPGSRRQGLHPGQHEVAQLGRQREPVGACGQHFLGEERVAVGS